MVVYISYNGIGSTNKTLFTPIEFITLTLEFNNEFYHDAADWPMPILEPNDYTGDQLELLMIWTGSEWTD